MTNATLRQRRTVALDCLWCLPASVPGHVGLSRVKDPTTGKRVSRITPPEDWITVDVPELRIVDDAL